MTTVNPPHQTNYGIPSSASTTTGRSLPVPILTIATFRPILLSCTMYMECMRIGFNNNHHSHHRPIQIRIRKHIHINLNDRHTNNPHRISPIFTSALILLPMHNHRVSIGMHARDRKGKYLSAVQILICPWCATHSLMGQIAICPLSGLNITSYMSSKFSLK